AFRPVQLHTVTGNVTDENGNPIPSVTIRAQGTKEGTVSSANGHYSLTLSNAYATLEFSAIGYVTKKVKLQGQKKLNIKLSASTAQLDEVVVTEELEAPKIMGQATMNRRDATLSYLNASPSGVDYDGNKDDYDVYRDKFNTEGYDHITENRFLKVSDNPLSTFSIDVDAASYSNMRRFINQGQLPPAGAVRIEEMINYFHYEYPQPVEEDPFSITTEISDAPWNKDHKLVLIGLQGKKISTEKLPASNIVFLIDVSGSMDDPMKLPLVKSSMKMLVDQLREQDRVAMVVYAGAAGLVLSPTSGSEKTKIKDAIDRLGAGGSTAGGEGIKLAYKTAKQHFIKGGNNRVILCTDGDFNVGASSDDEMETLIEKERESGVFLTVLGYGMGNYKDSKMQKLADKGNGNHAYIDGLSEAKKVLVNEFGGTLFTIAKDVKLQVEFNPLKVHGYRLIGYENRMLNKEDFNNDKKDAGDLGSGHTVTALYEVIPVGVKSKFLESVDKLKYQSTIEPLSETSYGDEIMTVKFRYKKPDEDISKLIEHPVVENHGILAATSDNFRFAASVAEFGMLLRNSEFKSKSNFENVLQLARKARGKDDEGYRAEFVRLVESASSLVKGNKQEEEDVTDEVKILPVNEN
ncbi:MAG TPA: von Willebrand factor type A domain-containing protein, partial [Chitinophagaceae bacterium]|nr:von Willebrand factor type A domain-containing protein [Chitinophagaceae bacterium]